MVDDDGVVVLFYVWVCDVFYKVEVCMSNEFVKCEWMCNGELGLDIYVMCLCLVEKGLWYYDCVDEVEE